MLAPLRLLWIIQLPLRSRLHRRLSSAFVSVVLIFCTLGSPQAGQADRTRRVGTDDLREGYEYKTFVTRTRSLGTMVAVPADLGRLSRKPPLGLEPPPHVPREQVIALGRRLFFDRRLSANETLSCGMCHIPEQAFTQNELATPVGIEGAVVNRNAPSLYNVSYRSVLFHDGRETSLERQIWAPLLAANEMGNADKASVLARIAAVTDYQSAFKGTFPDGLTEHTLGEALAAYQRALLSANSAFDRWYYGGEQSALSSQARAGLEIFVDRGCSACHQIGATSAQFTDEAFHNTGVGFASARRQQKLPATIQLAPGVFVPLNSTLELPDRRDLGRETVTGQRADRWQFRTPTLRNVALTSPYMHDGSLTDLTAVIEFYDRGGGGDPAQDKRIIPMQLDQEEKQALRMFLEALTGDNVDALAADARVAVIGDRQSKEH